MIDTIRQILGEVLKRLRSSATSFFPPLFAAVIVMAGAYVTALLARWALMKLFRAPRLDRFLRQSGLVSLASGSVRLRATRLIAEAAYWSILLIGFLAGLSVFHTDLTGQMVQAFVLLLPKLLVAALILVVGFWLGHYLGRSALIWAVNEGIPRPRRLACAVRIAVNFVAAVATAEYIDFAKMVFLAAFIILLAGTVLAAGLAIGLGGRDAARRMLDGSGDTQNDSASWASWTHL